MNRSFLVGMLAAALGFAPATPALSTSSPQQVVNYEQWQKELSNNTALQSLPQLAQQVYFEYVDILEDALDDPSLLDGEYAALGQELDELYLSISGRAREKGELSFILDGKPSEISLATKLVNGEDILLTKIATTQNYNLNDAADANLFLPGDVEAFSMLFESAERVILSLEGNGNTRTVDAVILYPFGDIGLSAESIIVPISSVDTESGEVPPSMALNWGCAFAGFWLAAVMTLALMSTAMCLTGAGWAACGGAFWAIDATISAFGRVFGACALTEPPTYEEYRTTSIAAFANL